MVAAPALRYVQWVNWVALIMILMAKKLAGLGRVSLTLVIAAIAWPVWALEIERFRVVGGTEALRAELRAASLLVELSRNQSVVPGAEALAAANADYARLLRVLYAQGYFGAEIEITLDGQEAAGISAFSMAKVARKARAIVTPGRPYRFGRLSIAPLAPGTELPEDFSTGAAARGPVLQDAVDAAVMAWRRAGHPMAAISGQSVTADHQSRRLNVDLHLSPRALASFGALQPTGTTAVKPRRIEQIAALPGGARYSPDVLDVVAERLRRTGAFASVSLIEANKIDSDGRLNILLDVQDAKPRKLGFGAELSSFEGLRLSGFWLHRNFFGGAERLRFDAEISGIGGQSGGIDYDLSAHLERPAVFGPDTNIFTFVNLRYDNEPAYEEWHGDLGIGLSRIFNDRIRGEVSAKFQFNETTDALGTRRLEMFALPAQVQWDNRDNALAPSKGAFADIEVTPFINLDGSGAGANLNVDLRGYRRLDADGRLVLAARAQLGATYGPALSQTPGEYLYYSGGGGTVRGQPYQSLGLAQGAGQSGGASFLGGSAELRMTLDRGFGLVGFIDAGFVGDGTFAGGGGNWHSGAGVGLRYDTGIGPIRVDLAAPVSGKTGKGAQLYIGIGQAF